MISCDLCGARVPRDDTRPTTVMTEGTEVVLDLCPRCDDDPAREEVISWAMLWLPRTDTKPRKTPYQTAPILDDDSLLAMV